MDRKKQVRHCWLVIAGLVIYAFLCSNPGPSHGEQTEIQKTPVMIFKPLKLKEVPATEQKKKVVLPSPTQVKQPVQVDRKKLEQLKVYPVLTPPPNSTGPIKQILPEYPPEPEPEEGLGRQNSKPISGQPQYPPASDPQTGLGSPSQPNPRCFIATAAYGSPLADNILVLENFRDEYLLTNRIGRWMVEFYYRNSPPVAKFISTRDGLRLVTRAALWPIVFFIEHVLVAAVVLVSVVFLVVASGIRRRKSS